MHTEPQSSRLWRCIDSLDAYIVTLILIVIFFDVVLQIVTRLLPGNAIGWTGELGEILLGAIIWLGLSAAVKTNGHIGFDLFVTRLTPKGKRIFGLINTSIFIAYLAVLGYLTYGLMQSYLRFRYKMPILGLSMYWVRMPILIGCVLGIVRLCIRFYRVATGKEIMYQIETPGQ